MNTSSLPAMSVETRKADQVPSHDAPRHSLADGVKALEALNGFIGAVQAAFVRFLMRGEEGQYFIDKLIELAAIVAKMPKTFEREESGSPAIVYLHYFYGGANWYITDKDVGAPDDKPEDFQTQASGLADIFGDGGEFGYISLPEILRAGAELEFDWEPKPLTEIRKVRKLDVASAGESPICP